MPGCMKTSDPEPTDNKKFVIGFSQVGSESDWRIANTKSMTETFSNDPEYEFVMENARQKQENQFASTTSAMYSTRKNTRSQALQ